MSKLAQFRLGQLDTATNAWFRRPGITSVRGLACFLQELP